MAVTTAAEAKKFVLKAYKLEADARADNNALLMTSPDSFVGSILDNPSQGAGYGFWAFQRYWFRIEANEPVSEFYIDWDDGENNSPEKANVSIIKRDRPSFFGIASHIFTQSKLFYPLIRVKSVEGFLSKWYTAHAGTGSSGLNTFAGLDDTIKNTASSSKMYDSGQNSFSVVSIEGSNRPTSANVAATGTVQFTNSAAADLDDSTVTVESTDGTTVVYTLDENRSSNSYESGITYIGIQGTFGHPSKAAELFTAAVNHASNAHTGKITASEGSSATVTLTQDVAGIAGNNTIATNDASDITVAGFTGGITYTPGTTLARIPVFEPANVPPVAVLKVDRKRVFSGIDNLWLGNNYRILNQSSGEFPQTDTVYAYCDNNNRTGVQVKVTYQEGVIGGEQNVFTIQTNTKGSGPSNGYVQAVDVAGAYIVITTMDETYKLWWNINSQQDNPPPAAPPTAVNIRVDCAGGGTGSGSETTMHLLSVETANALTAVDGTEGGVFYPAGQYAFGSEFTASTNSTGTATPSFNKTITITHNKKGRPFAAAGPAATYVAGTIDDLPMMTTHGEEGIDQTNAGVDGSDGTVKQKTLTTTASGILPQIVDNGSARIDNVYKILKAELVNNLENTDSYGGSVGLATLAAGERIFLMSSLSKDVTDSNEHPNLSDRQYNSNISNTICSVSLGNPIVDLNSLGTKLTADATESKVRCSNKSILYYYIDDNKLVSGDDTSHYANHQEQTTDQVSDKMISQANTDFQGTIGVKDLRYNFDWWRDHQDNNYRFYSTKRLLRAQVQDNHTAVTDDAFNISPIVHFEHSRYLETNVQAAGDQPSEIDKWNYGALLFTNQTKLRAPDWKNMRLRNNAGRLPIIGCLTNSTHRLMPSEVFDTISTADHYGPDNVSDATSTSETESPMVGPRNAIFMTRKEKYDRIFVRTSHDRFIAQAEGNPSAMDNDITVGDTAGWPKVRIQALYPAKKNANSSTIIWKALPIVDRTKLKGKDDSSLYTSGELIFNPPSDWEKTSHSTSIQYPFENNFYNDSANSEGINTVWNLSSYAILILITTINSTGGQEATKPSFNIMSIYPYNNPHSQLIEIVDPMHVSLNSYGIAQSVSFVRKGTFQEIKDRSGISQMRRVGAEGGAIKLGSIDLKGDVRTTRAKFDEFQRNAVPVYYDVIHNDDSITRLFGVMMEMSEDHPTAKLTPKFSCNMKITHIAEIDSSGNITGDGYKPLGGDVIDVEQYLSAS